MEALRRLEQIEIKDGVGDIANQAKAQSFADIVRCRETTNQRLLELYEKMYDDLKPKEPVNNRLAALKMIQEIVVHERDDPDFWETLRHTLGLFGT